MKLNELKKNECAIITKIECDKVLRSRLNALGVKKGEKLTLVELTLAKETIEIQINRTKIALRISEASNISVEPC